MALAMAIVFVLFQFPSAITMINHLPGHSSINTDVFYDENADVVIKHNRMHSSIRFISTPLLNFIFFIDQYFMSVYSILPYFISTPSLSYCLRLPVGGSVSVMRTTAVRDRERAMLWSKASMC